MQRTTVLEVLDECNIKFHDLDLVTRRKLVQAVEYTVPHARHVQSYKMGRWNGKVGFCNQGGGSYLNLLDKLLPIVEGAGYNVKIVDRRPQYSFCFPHIDHTYLADFCWPADHWLAGQPIILEDHQVGAINAFCDNLQALQELSTGAGKTVMTAALAKMVNPYGRMIIIVPNTDLVTGTVDDLKMIGLDSGVFHGDLKEYGKQNTVCTWQSLNVLEGKTEDDDCEIDIHAFLDGVVCVLTDECFDGDTLVLTPDGEKPIRDLNVGDKIINLDRKSNGFKIDVIKKIHHNLPLSTSEDMLELCFDNDRTIKVTANHKFLTRNRGWVRADELTEHDNIVEYKDKATSRRSYQQLLIDMNNILEEYQQQLRVIKWSNTEIHFNNGRILNIRAECMNYRRRMGSYNLIKYMDVIYGMDEIASQKILKQNRSETSSRGGKIVQELYGDKIIPIATNNLMIARSTGASTRHLKNGNIWCKGQTKLTNPGIAKQASSMMGSKNHRYGTHESAELRKLKSEMMKSKIKSGEFTPQVINSYTRKTYEYKGKKYRSSWEVMFACLEPDYEYETLRIPYTINGNNHIYIVDFVNHQTKHVVEIKPTVMKHTDKNIAKFCALNEWCRHNEYTYDVVGEDFLFSKFNMLDYRGFDQHTKTLVERYRGKYETDQS